MNVWNRRLGLGTAVVLSLTPLVFALATPPGEPKNHFFKGKVVPLAEVLAKFGAKLDADAGPHWLALVGDDGKVSPLIKDAGARMFFKDVKLLNRPMRLTARLHPESNMLQVINVHSYVKGQLHDVYYWCDICTIKGFEAGICDCCGGPMDFREVLAK